MWEPKYNKTIKLIVECDACDRFIIKITKKGILHSPIKGMFYNASYMEEKYMALIMQW